MKLDKLFHSLTLLLIFPLILAKNDKKTILKKPGASNDACTRMCEIDVEQINEFNFTKLESNWCSHIILSAADVEGSSGLQIGSNLEAVLDLFSQWKTDQKPLLIVAIGERTNNSLWEFTLRHAMFRTSIIKKIKKLITIYEIDGIDVSWTLEIIDNVKHMKLFDDFLKELRNEFPRLLIIVSVRPLTDYSSDIVDTFNTTADFVLLEGFKFHYYINESNLDSYYDPTMTIKKMALDWMSRGIDSHKLIIGMTTHGFGILQNDSIKAKNRKYSQTEICELRKNETTKLRCINSPWLLPYFIDKAGVVTYDSEKTVLLKSIWTSFGNYGGIALFNIEMDNIDGKCPPNKPFPLLKTIVKTQVCESCGIHKKQIENVKIDKCNSLFKVNCNYRLPTSKDINLLEPEKIPFHRCTEIVVEEDTLGYDGKIHQTVDEIAVKYRQKLIDAATGANFTNMVSSIRCNLTQKQFESLMDKNFEVINSIRKYTDENGFRGIELKCDNLLNPKNKAKFDSFLKALKQNFDVKDSANPETCKKTISIRIPIRTTNLNEVYEVSTLNSLNHVTLETFQTSTNKNKHVSLLFGYGGEDHLSIDSTIKAWVANGLKRSSIIFSLPSYVIVQKVTDNLGFNHSCGLQDQMYVIGDISRSQICVELSRPNIMDVTIVYAQTASKDWKSTKEWIIFETQETVKYKLKYALRENLGGIGFMSLNDDDFDNVCKQGAFPILDALYDDKCGF